MFNNVLGYLTIYIHTYIYNVLYILYICKY